MSVSTSSRPRQAASVVICQHLGRTLSDSGSEKYRSLTTTKRDEHALAQPSRMPRSSIPVEAHQAQERGRTISMLELCTWRGRGWYARTICPAYIMDGLQPTPTIRVSRDSDTTRRIYRLVVALLLCRTISVQLAWLTPRDATSIADTALTEALRRYCLARRRTRVSEEPCEPRSCAEFRGTRSRKD